MGIQGLLPLLKPVTDDCNLSSYRNRSVAVDAYSWIHKATYGCCTELCTDATSMKWVNYCINLVDLVLSFDIKLTLVFDGANLSAKKDTENERSASRDLHRKRGIELLKSGDHGSARNSFSRAVDVTPRMAAEFIHICRHHRPSVKCIVAPYEADAQLSFLSINNLVDAIITEDSDLIPYGCTEVLFKLDKFGNCQKIKLENIYMTPITGFDLRSFTHEMFMITCIASGCDYLDSLPGLGLKKSYKLVSKHRSVESLLKVLRMQGLVPLIPAPETCPQNNQQGMTSSSSSNILEYELGFHKAFLTFRHQIVYNTLLKKMTYLHDLPVIGWPEAMVGRPLDFLGSFLADDIACGIADGLLDPMTKVAFALPERIEWPLTLTQSSNRYKDDICNASASGGVTLQRSSTMPTPSIRNSFAHQHLLSTNTTTTSIFTNNNTIARGESYSINLLNTTHSSNDKSNAGVPAYPKFTNSANSSTSNLTQNSNKITLTDGVANFIHTLQVNNSKSSDTPVALDSNIFNASKMPQFAYCSTPPVQAAPAMITTPRGTANNISTIQLTTLVTTENQENSHPILLSTITPPSTTISKHFNSQNNVNYSKITAKKRSFSTIPSNLKNNTPKMTTIQNYFKKKTSDNYNEKKSTIENNLAELKEIRQKEAEIRLLEYCTEIDDDKENISPVKTNKNIIELQEGGYDLSLSPPVLHSELLQNIYGDKTASKGSSRESVQTFSIGINKSKSDSGKKNSLKSFFHTKVIHIV